MAQRVAQHASVDQLIHAQLIRETFAQSPLFPEAAVSQAFLTSEGEVALNVSFDGGPTVFRVVASSEDEAYAVLHELAQAIVEIAQRHGVSGEGNARTPAGGQFIGEHYDEATSKERENGSGGRVI